MQKPSIRRGHFDNTLDSGTGMHDYGFILDFLFVSVFLELAGGSPFPPHVGQS